MTDPKALADAIDPRVEHPAENGYVWIPRTETLIAASDTIRTLLSRIEELESAAALAGNMAIEQATEAAQNATLPDGFQWGREAMGSFEFGKRRAAEAIRSLSKPIDRNALIERGAEALIKISAANGRMACPVACSEPPCPCAQRNARAVLSGWIGEEKETK